MQSNESRSYTIIELDNMNRKELLVLIKKHELKGSGSNKILRERLIQTCNSKDCDSEQLLVKNIDVDNSDSTVSNQVEEIENHSNISNELHNTISLDSHRLHPHTPKLTKAALLRAQAIRAKIDNTLNTQDNKRKSKTTYEPYKGPVRPWSLVKK